MRGLKVVLAALALTSSSLSSSSIGVAAAAMMTTEYLQANDLNFTCTVMDTAAATSGNYTNVLLLHGFPMTKDWYAPLMSSWADYNDTAIKAVACDLRGYSPAR